MPGADIDVLQLLNDYIVAFNGRDLVAIENLLDAGVVVVVNGIEVVKGRDNILPSYAKDFATDKIVSIGTQPFVVEDSGEKATGQVVVQVGLMAIEPVPAATQRKAKTITTSLTVRYHYGRDGRHTRHEISDIVVTDTD
jgi:hypothetical protein